MIKLASGSILDAEAEALVNTVNCVGFMGRGIAAQFKRAFPENFAFYAAACARHEVEPGRMLVFPTGQLTNPRFIINFPTKRHWRGKSRIGDIEAGLVALIDEAKRLKLRSIAVPPLGCGLGGLNWSDVGPRIERAFEALPDVQVLIYPPRDDAAPMAALPVGDPPAMTPGRAILVGLVNRYLGGLMDPFVTLLEIHKLMYFMQEAGERLNLRYVAAPYGPYAENLRHVLAQVEGHFLIGYADGGDQPEKELKLVPGAVRDALKTLEQTELQETRKRFERVANLVAGFETPFGLELLSTVHWVLTRNRPGSTEDLVRAVYEWSPRKRQFSERQIQLAANVLREGGWGEREVAV